MIKKKLPLLLSLLLLSNTLLIPQKTSAAHDSGSTVAQGDIDYSSLTPEKIEEAIKRLTPEQLKEAQKMYMDQMEEQPEEVYFSDLIGLEHVKKTFATIVQYLENPEPYARRGMSPGKGILLIGGTRTGKSYSVKALYNEIVKSQKAKFGSNRFGFFEINASDIQATGDFKDIIDIARYNGPCVLFIDEIDLLYLQRGQQSPLLEEFLTSLSGALSSDDPKKQVIFIAATNNPERLNIALSDRLGGLRLRYELPSLQDRITFMERQLEKLSLDREQFDVATIAQQTEGHSFETLKNLVNNATLLAAINGRVVTQQDIMMIKAFCLRNNIFSDTAPKNL